MSIEQINSEELLSTLQQIQEVNSSNNNLMTNSAEIKRCDLDINLIIDDVNRLGAEGFQSGHIDIDLNNELGFTEIPNSNGILLSCKNKRNMEYIYIPESDISKTSDFSFLPTPPIIRRSYHAQMQQIYKEENGMLFETNKALYAVTAPYGWKLIYKDGTLKWYMQKKSVIFLFNKDEEKKFENWIEVPIGFWE